MNRHRRPAGWLLALALAAPGLARAEDPRPGVSARVTVTSVDLDASAEDAQGAPVTDLRPDEVTLAIDGKPAILDYFSPVATGHVRGSAPARSGADAEGNVSRSLYVLIDEDHIEPGSREAAYGAARTLLGTLRSSDRFAAATLNRVRIRPIVGFGTPADEAAAALLARGKKPDAGFLLKATFEPDAMHKEERNTLNQLQRTIRALGAQRGRKELIVIAEGYDRWVGGPKPSLMREVVAMTRQANRSRVTIHTIGTRGEQSGFKCGADTCWTLDEMSEETGGLHFHSGSAFTEGVRRIHRSAESYYTLGSTMNAPPKSKDGYRVELRSSRPGVTVRIRPRAIPREPGDGAREAADALSLDERVPTELPLKLEVAAAATPRPGLLSRRELGFELRVPMSALEFERVGDHREARVEVTVIAIDETGDASEAKVLSHTIVVTDAQWETAQKATWPYEGKLVTRPGTVRFTAVLRDVQSNRLGSAEVTRSIP